MKKEKKKSFKIRVSCSSDEGKNDKKKDEG